MMEGWIIVIMKYRSIKFRIQYFIVFVTLICGCESKLVINECDIFNNECDLELCEKFQDALIMIQLSEQQLPISLHKVQASVKYLEETTGIKSKVNSWKIPTYASRKDMYNDIELWMNWLEDQGCGSNSEEYSM